MGAYFRDSGTETLVEEKTERALVVYPSLSSGRNFSDCVRLPLQTLYHSIQRWR
jgi:hypothetical protein